MWTPADRARVGHYGSGHALNDEQWEVIKRHIPPAKPGGRKRTTDLRKVLDALFYQIRTGCQWAHLPPPPNFLPSSTVYGYFRLFIEEGVWHAIRHHLVMEIREQEGKEASPTAAIIDSQSVKTTESGGPRGYDGNKKVNGRKRHIAVDTLGLLLAIAVHPANIQDRDGAVLVLDKLKPLYCWLLIIFADGGYTGEGIAALCLSLAITLIIVQRRAGVQGFVVLPKRWIVERTLAWLGRHRRLSKDYERLIETSQAMVEAAAIRLMLERWMNNKSRLQSCN